MRALPRSIFQGAALLALSAALAFGVNAVRPDGLPMAQAAAQSSVQLGQSKEIGIKDAAMLFVSGRAVFVDARAQYEYELGHIQGALWLPPREFAAQFQDLKPKLMGKEAVIAYCDGDRCPLSQSLAEHLRGAGLTNVYVLKNGWSLWQAEKLPTAKGRPEQQGVASASAPASQASQTAQTQVKSAKKAAAKSGAGICRDCEEK